MRKTLTVLACVTLLSIGLSQEQPASNQQLDTGSLSINTRVAILENRMDRIQTSVDDLRTVPSQLARIEEQIRSLGDKSGSNSNVLQELGVGLSMAVITGVLGFISGKRSRDE